MKIYRTVFPICLVPSSRDRHLLEEGNFDGTPFPGRWRCPELMFQDKDRPLKDFYSFGRKAFVCSERVSLFAGQLWDEGEFLPVRIQGLKKAYYIYNVTHCPSHLNHRKTVWKTNPATKTREIQSPAFYAERLGEDCVFKIPEDGATAIYCLELPGDAWHDGLKKLVRRHNLTGIRFKLVWSDKKNK